MSRILTSLHGKDCGLDADRRFVVPKGFVSGENGKQIALPSPTTVAFFDDFLGDVIADQWNFVEGTDSTTTDAAILSGGIGGVLRVTSGDAGTGLAADLAQLTQALQWQASNGGLAIEARFKISAITEDYVFFGFTDLTTLEAPIISAGSANTITTTASDAVGFMFDTRMSTDNWWLVGVKGNTDATHQNVGSAPVADTYATYRIEINADGDAVFYINGLQVGTAMADAITAATDLTPTIMIGKLSTTTSVTMDIDYVHVAMNR